MLLSSIIMFYYILGIVSYITSGPSVTLIDDTTTEFVVQIILLGLGLFYLIIAWFRHISYSIVALVFIALYIIYTSVLHGVVMVGFLPIAMTCDAAGFIILGLIKKYRKKQGYNIYVEPIVDELEGPDIFNFRI